MKKRNSKIQEFVLTSGAKPLCAKLGINGTMVSGDSLNTLSLWRINKERPIISLNNPNSNSNIQSEVSCVSFGINEYEVYSGSNRGLITTWDINSQKLNATLKGHTIGVSSITPFDSEDRKHLILSGALDGNIKLWDLRQKNCAYTYKGHNLDIKTLQVSPNGEWFVSGSQDSKVKIWEISTGKALTTFEYHDFPVTCAKFNPFDLTLATGSLDRTVKYYELEKWNMLYSSKAESSGILSLIFDEGGKHLYSATQESLKVWKVLENSLQLIDIIESNWRGIQDLGINNIDGEETLVGITISPICFGLWAVPFKQIHFDGPPIAEKREYTKSNSNELSKNRSSTDGKPFTSSTKTNENDVPNIKKPLNIKAYDVASPPTVNMVQPNAASLHLEKIQQECKPQSAGSKEHPIKKQGSNSLTEKHSMDKNDQVITNDTSLHARLQLDNCDQNFRNVEKLEPSTTNNSKNSTIHLRNRNLDNDLNYTAFLNTDPEIKRQNDIMFEMMKDHNKFKGVISTRINHLKHVLHWWNSGNIKSAVNAISMMHIADPTVAVDLLNIGISLGKGSPLPPEAGYVFLQKAAFLLECKIDVHIRKGIEFISKILKIFQDVNIDTYPFFPLCNNMNFINCQQDIISIKNVPVMNMVDFSREERIKKYDKILEELEKIYNKESFKKRAEKRKDDLGELAAKLRNNLELFLNKIKKSTQQHVYLNKLIFAFKQVIMYEIEHIKKVINSTFQEQCK